MDVIIVMDELRLKNALRCQIGQGSKYCFRCPYSYEYKCDIQKIASDALSYIAGREKLINTLRDQIVEMTSQTQGLCEDTNDE